MCTPLPQHTHTCSNKDTEHKYHWTELNYIPAPETFSVNTGIRCDDWPWSCTPHKTTPKHMKTVSHSPEKIHNIVTGNRINGGHTGKIDV